jgi:hypothetical protein
MGHPWYHQYTRTLRDLSPFDFFSYTSQEGMVLGGYVAL